MSVDTDAFDGTCDVWEESIRRARKDHKCDACRETIKRGDLYHATRSLYDGSWTTTYRCARCETMYRFLGTVMGSGEVCHEELDCGHTWEENFDEPPPPEIAALAFMTAAEAQALLGPAGLRTRVVEDGKRKLAEFHFRAKASSWFRDASRREWWRRVQAENAAAAARAQDGQ